MAMFVFLLLDTFFLFGQTRFLLAVFCRVHGPALLTYYILCHYGHARSRRRESARRVETALYFVYIYDILQKFVVVREGMAGVPS